MRFFNFKCKHPAARLVVAKREVRTKLNDDFDVVKYHLACLRCGESVEVQHAEVRDGTGRAGVVDELEKARHEIARLRHQVTELDRRLRAGSA